jgi:hypothetical protein
MAFTSSVAQNYEAITYRGPSLSLARGKAREIIELAAAATLLPAQSHALVLMDAAAGFTITLPTPTLATIGMEFEFLQTVTQTSGTQKITAGTGIFLLGEVLTYTTATASPAGFAFDGSTHIAYTSNGTTTGGIIGTRLLFTALSATVWSITGTVVGSGTIATPASTT